VSSRLGSRCHYKASTRLPLRHALHGGLGSKGGRALGRVLKAPGEEPTDALGPQSAVRVIDVGRLQAAPGKGRPCMQREGGGAWGAGRWQPSRPGAVSGLVMPAGTPLEKGLKALLGAAGLPTSPKGPMWASPAACPCSALLCSALGAGAAHSASLAQGPPSHPCRRAARWPAGLPHRLPCPQSAQRCPTWHGTAGCSYFARGQHAPVVQMPQVSCR
jgi:hypothetical protein